MDAVFVLYDQMTALDLVGPHEVLASHPSVTPHFAAAAAGPVPCDGGLVLHAGMALRDATAPDLIVVPGSARWLAVLDDSAELIAWLAAAAPAARWTASVCTGSTLLARAGLLARRPATTHWAARGTLAACGAVVTAGRVVHRRERDHQRRGLGRDRPRPDPRRAAVGRARRHGHPARPRVRPGAAVRLWHAGQGAARGDRRRARRAHRALTPGRADDGPG
jgi:putative intracellular protease/amidase